MKRYALFFLFIGIQVTFSLSTSIEEYAKEKFEKKCNKLIPTKDASVQTQDAVFAFKNKCWQEVKHNFEGLSDEQAKKEVQKQIALCLTKDGQQKLKNSFDKNITLLQDELKNPDPEYEMRYQKISDLWIRWAAQEKLKELQEIVIGGFYEKSFTLDSVEKMEYPISLFDGTLEHVMHDIFFEPLLIAIRKKFS